MGKRKRSPKSMAESAHAFVRKHWGRMSPIDIAIRLPSYTVQQITAMAESSELPTLEVKRTKPARVARIRTPRTADALPPPEPSLPVTDPAPAVIESLGPSAEPDAIAEITTALDAGDASNLHADESEARQSDGEPGIAPPRPMPPVTEPNNRVAALVRVVRSAVDALVAEGHDARTAADVVRLIAQKRIPGVWFEGFSLEECAAVERGS